MNQDRRALLAGAAGAGAAAVAGCAGIGREEDPVRVEQTSLPSNSGGPLVVEVVVSNVADRAVTTTLYVTAELEQGARARQRQITMQPHSTATYRVAFDVSYDEAVKGSVQASATVRQD